MAEQEEAERAAEADAVTAGTDEDDVAALDETPEPVRRPKAEWVTLGSMDPASGYNMLVTFDSRGGSIDRIELTERKENGRLKYRRVDVRSGYLGYLALAPSLTADGALVRVVGPGTPAALAPSLDNAPAGLRPGDLIVAANERPITTALDLAEVLEKTDPGDELVVEVLRPAAAPADDAEDAESAADAAEPPAPTPLRFQATLSEHPLDLVRLADTAGAEQIRGNLSRASCLMTLTQVGRKSIRTGQSEISGLTSQHSTVWDLQRIGDGTGYEFRLPLAAAAVREVGGSGAVELVRRYSLAPGSYAIDMEMEVINHAEENQQLGYRLEGPNGVTLEGWWYSTKISPNFSGAAARDMVYNTVAENHELLSAYNLLERAKDTPESPVEVVFTPDGPEGSRQLRYMGVDAQYFITAYVPPEGEAITDQFVRGAGIVVADAERIPAHQERATNISFYLDSQTAEVAPGESLKQSIRLFAGPKQPDLLAAYGMGETLEYGWFGWIAAPLSWLLHGFYAIAGNYALAIILLTLLVRGCMFPLGRRAAIHAQKMQELAPELKKISEKYKDDFEKRLKAQRELQQRVGFNPLSGCLPMFVQLPIFIGLYRALSVDIELRQAALHPALQWCSNLAGPDMLYYWGDWLWDYLSGRGTGWLGPYFNILPIVVVALFLAQQKMFMPPATDEQTAMTQKVMTIMTMMMGLFFFRVPSGLCIYFITSSLWGIVERKMVKKTIPAAPQGAFPATVDGTVTQSSVTNDNGRPSLADRLRTAAGMPGEEPKAIVPPSKRRKPPTRKGK
ncbi:membrane protein insertase YidC [Candidatus Laterigemmans baculatus]|uniref:membrane protein insertase YidC n=1 Tax=Candidatus Laterigemmans baculatus TaxID=2770505 RepID=UPI001F28D5A6|nr:membrane protein insertase YidC [Candidatus Laterigemmans baculatus]